MNTFGKLFKVTIYGASHESQIGVIVDGMPSGILFDDRLIASDLTKRRPQGIATTPRIENDLFEVTSGVFNGYTTGSSIHVSIKNENKRSQDYDHLKDNQRPGHADFVAYHKYHGFADYRGGGIFSGRVTSALVVAGAIAKMILPFAFSSKLIQVGTCKNMAMLDQYLEEVVQEGDSVGGLVKLKVDHVPIGLGEHFFGKVESILGQLLFAVPSVKGVTFGKIHHHYDLKGSVFNEPILNEKGLQEHNYAGGIHGGITNGNPIEVTCFIKPTPSISKPQQTFNVKNQSISDLHIKGRHDVAHIKRIRIVLENVMAIGLADLYLIHKAYQ